MKRFLAIYTGSTDAFDKWRQLDPREREEREKQGVSAWKQWASTNAGTIVDAGGPLGKTKRVEPGGISDIRNAMTAYTVVDAESHEAAAKLFEGHPHFTVFPGDGIEVMEILPLPGER
jgi:hypothetical protein